MFWAKTRISQQQYYVDFYSADPKMRTDIEGEEPFAVLYFEIVGSVFPSKRTQLGLLYTVFAS